MAHQVFFQRQANARRNTFLLVLLFSAAVVLITLAVCLVGYYTTRSETTGLNFLKWLQSSHGLYTAAAVIVLIAGGSLIRWLDLAGGGHRVAKMVNARPIDPATQDRDERRLRNVVEEMAIASGISVPDVYVMDNETGINAFVAGYTPGEAVMVVTHGTLTQLTRDELQGVVGHEFSHILNGDMRLNVRLIAILAGILMVGQIGSFLLRSAHFGVSSSRDRRGQAAFALVGLALMLVGYIGVFFGRLIQSAVSRQREMLADASSVQFTRNPDGIAGALYKIGIKTGYLETTSHASDVNHMCFGESTQVRLSSLLASHPPIQQRIEAIQPGMFARLRSRFRDSETSDTLRSVGNTASAHMAPEGASGFTGSMVGSTSPLSRTTGQEPVSASVGTIPQASEDYARGLLSQLPSTFKNLLYTRAGAVQLCYALLVHDTSELEVDQHLAQLNADSIFKPNRDILDKLMPTLSYIGAGVRLPALELAMPALRKLDPEERAQLLSHCQTLIKADQKLSLFELSMISFLQKHLAGNSAEVVPVKHRNYKAVMPHLQVVFSVMARLGAGMPDQQESLLKEAMAGFTSRTQTPKLLTTTSLKQLREALWQLNRLSPVLKPGLIDACSYCVLSDGEIKAREYEMIRLIADQLDCPMPPLKA